MEEKSIKTVHRYNTFINMNKPIYLKGGYSFGQLVIAAGAILFSILVFGYLGLLAIYPAYKFSQIIAAQNKKGHPDIFKSWEVKRYSPKYILDNGRVYSKLKKDGK